MRGRREAAARADRARAQRHASAEALQALLPTSTVARRTQRARRGQAAIAYPPELPVAQRAADIAAAIREHPVVIVCGETGSGKTTQLPKICLELGRGERGLIGHTQPRRIAARAVARASRRSSARALGDSGRLQGPLHRPHAARRVRQADDRRHPARRDAGRPRCSPRYDTIIIDEAHERSLNIDFLLGYLKQLLPRRPELKLIITSATIDAERFARHFGDRRRAGAGDRGVGPHVSGRSALSAARRRRTTTRPTTRRSSRKRSSPRPRSCGAKGRATSWCSCRASARSARRPSCCAQALARRPYARAIGDPAAVRAPVGRRAAARVRAARGRRIVLATNVAETSLTVPGIRYVIDTGLARVKRYSLRNKTTLLQIEKISQAAANQRAGRCGRVADGICVRLYDEDDFAARPEYTDPEILRCVARRGDPADGRARAGRVDAFPFLEPPAPRAIADGYQLLQELGAVDANAALTPLGRELARLPVDPRIGRMVLAAREDGCLAEMLVIASALSVPDPRERPLERAAGGRPGAPAVSRRALRFPVADRAVGILRHALRERSCRIASCVEACRAHFVSFLRMTRMARRARAADRACWPKRAGPSSRRCQRTSMPRGTRRSIVRSSPDLLGNIGVKSEPAAAMGGQYDGARGIAFFLHPGSGLAKKAPKWVLAAELTQTSRLFARCAGRIEPEWIEAVAGDRVNRDYFDAHWDKARGEVVASERMQLYGLTLVARRPIVVWRARAARGAGRLHSRGARRRRAGTGGTVCRAQPRAGRRNRRARAQGAPGRRARRRRRDCRVLFRTHSGRRSLARDVRALAQDGRAQPSATALPHARSVDASCGAFGDRGAVPRDAGALPVRTFRSNTDSRPDIRSTASR